MYKVKKDDNLGIFQHGISVGKLAERNRIRVAMDADKEKFSSCHDEDCSYCRNVVGYIENFLIREMIGEQE